MVFNSLRYEEAIAAMETRINHKYWERYRNPCLSVTQPVWPYRPGRAPTPSDDEDDDTDIQAVRDDLTKLKARYEWTKQKETELLDMSFEAVVRKLGTCLELFGELDVLSLEAEEIGPREYSACRTMSWHPTWIVASEAYRRVLAAIPRSGFKLNAFHIYRDTPICSVPGYDIGESLELIGSEPHEALASVRSFSLSFSTYVTTSPVKILKRREKRKEVYPSEAERHWPYSEEQSRHIRAIEEEMNVLFDKDGAADDWNFQGIPRLLQCMPNLQTLDLHMFNLWGGEDAQFERLFGLLPDLKMSQLSNCTLRGLHVSEESMLRFLYHHRQIGNLTLGGVIIKHGTWDRVFAVLWLGMSGLVHLHLHDLWDNQRRRNLLPVWASHADLLKYDQQDVVIHHQLSDTHMTPFFVMWDFDRADILKGVIFRRPPQGPEMDSQQAYTINYRRRALYGPLITTMEGDDDEGLGEISEGDPDDDEE